MEKLNRHKLTAVVLTALVSVLAIAFSWMTVGAQESGEPGVTLAPATDSVGFNANLRAEEKPPEVLTRYASTIVGEQTWMTNTPGEAKTTTQNGAFTVEAGESSYSSDVCVHGGENAQTVECWNDGDVSGASTTNGVFSVFADVSLLGLGLDAPLIGASIMENSLSTRVRCFLDETGQPSVTATPPVGIVGYGGANTLGLITSGKQKNIAEIGNGISWNPEPERVGSLLGWGDVYTQVTPTWNDDNASHVYSEVELSFRTVTGGLLGLNRSDSGWKTLTIRSECGFSMSGDARMGLLQAPAQAPLPAPQAASLTLPPITSAPGTPQALGFTTEGTLLTEMMDYHLLATRELDLLDRLVIEEVLAEISETGEVEGSNWKLFDAVAAGEQIPVIEIELGDGAIVQVRPIIDGVVLPSPDLIELPTTTLTSPPASTTQEATITEEATTTATPVEPTDISPEAPEPTVIRESDA